MAMTVDAKHPQYNKFNDLWLKINDVVNGENLEKYLIKLNPIDNSDSNKKRNEQYLERAIFYAIASWTVSGMVGTMFTRCPELVVPDSLSYMKTNCDGAGKSIYQQSQAISESIIKNSRAGLSVSFPVRPSDAPLSMADIQSGLYIPRIHEYKPEQIINWNQKTVGSKTFLSLVCTAEVETVESDFEHIETNIIRERRIDNDGYYFERIWKEVKKDNATIEWDPESAVYPQTAGGEKLKEILFTFIGSVSNTPEVNKPLMKDIVRINIGHYRNSADFEDNVWYLGQSQAWMSGISQEHIDLMKENNMYVGSRELIGVPSGEQFDIASAPANPLVREAMKDKIELMVGLGARFMQSGGAVKTATQASGDLAMQHSVLSLIASNISEAYTACLKWCLMFLSETADDTYYEINQDFVKLSVDAQMLQQVVASWLSGALPASDLYSWMRKNDFIDQEKTDDEIRTELASGGNGTTPPINSEM